MAKILLVEDDKNLQEIYAAQLTAEGHNIISAYDGEQGLSLAASEHPDLIITDAMMPRVSGLQFLDILRSTPATANIKVIAMTALSQADDRAQFEKLGVERFLVKSQVTLEDVARVVNEVLNPGSSTTASSTADDSMAATSVAAGVAATVIATQAVSDNSSAAAVPASTSEEEQSEMMRQIQSFVETSPVINSQPLQVEPLPVQEPVSEPVEEPIVTVPVVEPIAEEPVVVQPSMPIADVPAPVAAPVQAQPAPAESTESGSLSAIDLAL